MDICLAVGDSVVHPVYRMDYRGWMTRDPDRIRAAGILSSLPTIRPEGFLLPFLPHAGANAKVVRRTSSVHTTCDTRPMRLHDYAPRPAHLKWLLDSDPAIRWQVMRDLTGEALNAIAAERSRVATEGWGARLLALQSSAGNWGGPKEDR